MAKWQCMAGCGACCFLDPESRADVQDYLNPDEWQQYLGLVSESGWCKHYDTKTRKCQIYENRPRFCRVTPKMFQELYQIEAEDFNDFAIDCCRVFIADEYGELSFEAIKYEQAILES